jgi:hypothetical protein
VCAQEGWELKKVGLIRRVGKCECGAESTETLF